MLHLRRSLLIVALVAIVSMAAGVEVTTNAEEPNSPIGGFATSGRLEIAPAAVVPGGPGFFSQSSYSLRPLFPTDKWSFDGQFLANTGTAIEYFLGTPELPNGVAVNKIVIYYYDNSSTSDIHGYLNRMPLDAQFNFEPPMAEFNSNGALPGIQHMEVPMSANPIIDMQSYSYYVEVDLPADTNVKFLSYRIDYQYPGYLPAVMKNSN